MSSTSSSNLKLLDISFDSDLQPIQPIIISSRQFVTNNVVFKMQGTKYILEAWFKYSVKISKREILCTYIN